MMFEHSEKPNVYGMPLGADFALCLAREVTVAYSDRPPEELARVEIFVNTSRMRRSLVEAFQQGPALLLPKIRLVTDIIDVLPSENGDGPKNDLRTKLELSQLVRALIERQVSRAPRAAVYDLSDSLSKLMDEMQGEGVSPEDVFDLDVTDQSGHWQDSLEFIRILAPYFEKQSGISSRQRRAAKKLREDWEATPPDHPVIVAGSTASRGATRLFMKSVARLSNGVIVLPGFDFDHPEVARANIDQEDHPQYRLAAFLKDIDLDPDDIQPWPNSRAPAPARNKLVSLALRPAPVTKEWISQGPKLGSLVTATDDLTLLEADSPRQEAEAIALRMRKSLDQGLKCALVTPDRMLTRQVTAALDRWDLVPDDSAGTPLLLSAPGRFLSQLVASVGEAIPSHALLALLKHPLCNSSEGNRGDHLRWTRDLELHVRKQGLNSPSRKDLYSWIEKEKKEDAKDWAHWLADFLEANERCRQSSLCSLFEAFVELAENFAAGPNEDGSGGLWQEAAGREAKSVCEKLAANADAAGNIPHSDFPMILLGVLADGVVRDRDVGHPDLLILGTLEARVQSADLVILGGLNEGIWPEAPSPDPWLNRKMRKSVGLLLPERQIGLSAHDFQQAISAPKVWLTRSKRTADAETVPSRWLNRLLNLMDGLPEQGGPEAVKKMLSKGDQWKSWADALSIPEKQTAPASRPSPCPPTAARPTELSVTRIKTLIRDPFAIYAERILRLPRLDPLLMEANAPLRGIIFHSVLERFVDKTTEVRDPESVDHLVQIAQEELDAHCPWPAIRLRWLTQFQALAPAFVRDEVDRRKNGRVAGLELRGRAKLSKTNLTLKGVADRIDVDEEGRAKIYDYKTGVVPTIPQQEKFDKQLLLEAAMVSNGAFEGLDPLDVSSAEFISIKPDMKKVKAPLEKQPPERVWQDLETLIKRWSQAETGYTARMAMVSKTDVSPYDHLSRFGEWTLSDLPRKERLK